MDQENKMAGSETPMTDALHREDQGGVMTTYCEGLLAAAKVCREVATNGSLKPGMEAMPALYCAERILALAEQEDQRGADRPVSERGRVQLPHAPRHQRGAAVDAAAESATHHDSGTPPSGICNERDAAGNAAQSAPHPDPAGQRAREPDAYLITFREDDKYGNRLCCTMATLEPCLPAVDARHPEDTVRTLIKAEPLYAAPALPGPWCTYCGSNTHEDARCWSTRPRPWGPQNPGYKKQHSETMRVPTELALCETPFVFLRPNEPYIFRVVEGCKTCAMLAAGIAGIMR